MTGSRSNIWHDSEGLIRLIDQHLQWYPSMAPRDAYKLLYQGVLGPEHSMENEFAFRERLLLEFASLEARQGEQPYEPVRPDGLLVRINLRPFKFRNGDLESLITACLLAGREEWGKPEDLMAAWDAFCALCQEGRWPGFGPASVSECSVWLKAQGYPAVHHSQAYRKCHQPSYLLVAKAALPALSPDWENHDPKSGGKAPCLV